MPYCNIARERDSDAQYFYMIKPDDKKMRRSVTSPKRAANIMVYHFTNTQSKITMPSVLHYKTVQQTKT